MDHDGRLGGVALVIARTGTAFVPIIRLVIAVVESRRGKRTGFNSRAKSSSDIPIELCKENVGELLSDRCTVCTNLGESPGIPQKHRRARMELLDPKWREPRLQCMAPADLARHARQWECLVVRPGVATRPLPTEPGDPA